METQVEIKTIEYNKKMSKRQIEEDITYFFQELRKVIGLRSIKSALDWPP